MTSCCSTQHQDRGKIPLNRAEPIRQESIARDLVPAAALLTLGLTGLLTASLSGAVREGQYLVIAAPWSSLGRTINLVRDADGGFVEAGRMPNIVIASSSHADFATRARQAGAWLVLPSPRLAGCSGDQSESFSR